MCVSVVVLRVSSRQAELRRGTGAGGWRRGATRPGGVVLSSGCSHQETMEEEKEEEASDGCLQNKTRHCRRVLERLAAPLRRVTYLRQVGERGRRGAEPWTQGQAW